MSDEEVLFARGSTNPLGKCSVEFKTLLPESIHNNLVMLASVAGVPPSEYARELLSESVIGRATLLRLQANRSQGRPVSWPEQAAT